jgi:4-hydroxy-4-methyl-2-oxoglutarate aldolase
MKTSISERLERCYTGAVHDVMRLHGLSDFVLPWAIRRLFPGRSVAGPAFTFRGHADAHVKPHDTYLAWTRFLGDIPAGSVGICQPNDHRVAHMGELSAETLKLRGVKGYVVDGGCRDVAFIRRIGFPVWCRYATPADIVGYWLPEGFGEPIQIENVTVRCGDYILADEDGVIVVPSERVAEITSETEEMIGRENLVRKAILAGMHPQEAYLTYRKF